ncbi:MAG TPA: GH36 C-terminal domain-containing protein, partial [Candidatus Hydrogenedentes bacterium]|nr:GH36 C-terminal domain-containing protein [Candidatus Hydrogenedentota bacterium]
TEIRYVEGYLRYFDALRQRHPGMLIDSCASGGRRNDLETMRRAVPLLRTDLEQIPEAHQSVTYGFDLWLPYHDSVNWEKSVYGFRSTLAPFLVVNWDIREAGFDFDEARRFIAEWSKAVPYFFGDFYPVSPYGTGDDVWLAWQWDRPEQGDGLIQAFRRAKSPYESARYPLRALNPEASYVITSPDDGQVQRATGRELMEKGILITMPEPRSAFLLFYEKNGN